MSRPLWGKGDRVSGGRGELALNPRLPPNQRTYPNHYHANKTALHTKGHTIPQASSPSPSPHGPTSPQRARLIYMRHYQLQVILATAKQEPLKSRPLWGKGDRASGGRGELAGYLDCPPTNAPIPTTTVQLTRTNHARPYNTVSELPLSEPSRAHLSPKGEAYCMNHANKPHYTRKAIQSRKRALPLRALTGATSPQRARLIL